MIETGLKIEIERSFIIAYLFYWLLLKIEINHNLK